MSFTPHFEEYLSGEVTEVAKKLRSLQPFNIFYLVIKPIFWQVSTSIYHFAKRLVTIAIFTFLRLCATKRRC
jgi:hypothetical protein